MEHTLTLRSTSNILKSFQSTVKEGCPVSSDSYYHSTWSTDFLSDFFLWDSWGMNNEKEAARENNCFKLCFNFQWNQIKPIDMYESLVAWWRHRGAAASCPPHVLIQDQLMSARGALQRIIVHNVHNVQCNPQCFDPRSTHVRSMQCCAVVT